MLWGNYADSLKELPDLLAKVSNDDLWDWLNLSRNQLGARDTLHKIGEDLASLAHDDLPAAQTQFRRLTEEYKLNKEQQYKLLETMPAYKDALVEQANKLHINVSSSDEAANKQKLLKLAMDSSSTATDANAESTDAAAGAYEDAARQAQELADQIDQLVESIDKANGVGQDAVTSNANYQQAVAEVKDTIEQAKAGVDGYSTSIEQSTSEGAKNAAMFADLAQKSQDAAKAQYDLDGNTGNYVARLQAGRQALIDQITDLTGNRDAAEKLADQIYQIPSQKQIQILTNTQQEIQKAKDLQAWIDTLHGKRVVITVETNQVGAPINIPAGAPGRGNMQYANGGVVKYFAGGGISENHIAQIARAGTMRVWNEPETEGEAYIPYATSKRARSTAILTKVANDFGYELVPTSSEHFAAGAVTVAPTNVRSNRSQVVNFTVNNPVSRDPVQELRDAGQALSAAMGLGE